MWLSLSELFLFSTYVDSFLAIAMVAANKHSVLVAVVEMTWKLVAVRIAQLFLYLLPCS